MEYPKGNNTSSKTNSIGYPSDDEYDYDNRHNNNSVNDGLH